MKNKTFKRLICFLLALVVMISLPLDLQANAVAIEPWLLYAMITYMTAVGFTFAVSGGVDAMINALEEKANEYSNNIIDFYDIMRQNIKLVPNPNRPPNTDFLSLFFTASGVEAMNSFIEWLVSDGGLIAGENNFSQNLSTFTANYNGEDTVVWTTTGITQNPAISSYVYNFEQLGFVIPVSRVNMTVDEPFLTSQLFNYNANYRNYSPNKLAYLSGLVRDNNYNYDSLAVNFVYGGTVVTRADRTAVLENTLKYSKPFLDHISGITFGYNINNKFTAFFVSKYNYLIEISSDIPVPVDIVNFSSSCELLVPENIIKPLPTVQEGFLMSNVELGSESLNEWANMVEELFIQTGTIPNPQPEIIQDPDYVPPPTPAPTPVPSPEIEDIDDLGLPTLGEAIFNKFPFSLPKDLKRIADILNAEPVTPFWEVNLYETLGNRVPFVGDTTIRIDLAEYEALGQISRWASVITFVIFLVIITKGVIRW